MKPRSVLTSFAFAALLHSLSPQSWAAGGTLSLNGPTSLMPSGSGPAVSSTIGISFNPPSSVSGFTSLITSPAPVSGTSPYLAALSPRASTFNFGATLTLNNTPSTTIPNYSGVLGRVPTSTTPTSPGYPTVNSGTYSNPLTNTPSGYQTTTSGSTLTLGGTLSFGSSYNATINTIVSSNWLSSSTVLTGTNTFSGGTFSGATLTLGGRNPLTIGGVPSTINSVSSGKITLVNPNPGGILILNPTTGGTLTGGTLRLTAGGTLNTSNLITATQSGQLMLNINSSGLVMSLNRAAGSIISGSLQAGVRVPNDLPEDTELSLTLASTPADESLSMISVGESEVAEAILLSVAQSKKSTRIQLHTEKDAVTGFEAESIEGQGSTYLAEVSGEDITRLDQVHTQSIQFAAVPEPGSAVMLLSGLAFLATRRRRVR